jgi:hypothetical protein
VSRGTAQTRTLHRAVDLCGGVAALAKILDVPAETIAGWLDGHATLPVDIYIKALDLVARGQPRRAKTYG